MIGIATNKVYMVDSSYASFDWMIHKEDIEHLLTERISDTTFIDINIVSIMLGIPIHDIEESIDGENSSRDPDFPPPELRRGRQLRWRLKMVIKYIEKLAEAEAVRRYRYHKDFEERRATQRDQPGEM